MEPAVAERRSWPIEAVLEEYESYSEQAANVFASVQDAPLSETMLPMGELGTHPMSILPSTFLFDGYTHLRNDILTPNGSIERPQPPRDEKRAGRRSNGCRGASPDVRRRLAGIVDRPIAPRSTVPAADVDDRPVATTAVSP
jgi:hypothetical protein